MEMRKTALSYEKDIEYSQKSSIFKFGSNTNYQPNYLGANYLTPLNFYYFTFESMDNMILSQRCTLEIK